MGGDWPYLFTKSIAQGIEERVIIPALIKFATLKEMKKIFTTYSAFSEKRKKRGNKTKQRKLKGSK